MFNIFQGNNIILSNVAKSLGYDADQTQSWFTRDIYFQAFFYLSKRFGPPTCFDSYKEAGAWSFKVKQYIIEIRLNSSWVEFMVYGKISNMFVHNPYVVKLNRERLKKRDLIIGYGKWNEAEKTIAKSLFKTFMIENNIDESLTQEQFNEKYTHKWYDRIGQYNESVLNINYDDIVGLYGYNYHNSYTRHAIKTLNQFLNNMLTPIWVRDVAYNIKGKLSDEEALFYRKYSDNIAIELK